MAATSLGEVPVPVNKRTGPIPLEVADLGPQAVKAAEIRRREAAMKSRHTVLGAARSSREHAR